MGCALFQQNQLRSAHSRSCRSFDRHAAGQTSILLRDLQVACVVSGRGKQRRALQVSTLTAVSSVRAHPGSHDWGSSRQGLTQTTPCALHLRSCSSGLGSSLQNLFVNLPSSRSPEVAKISPVVSVFEIEQGGPQSAFMYSVTFIFLSHFNSFHISVTYFFILGFISTCTSSISGHPSFQYDAYPKFRVLQTTHLFHRNLA